MNHSLRQVAENFLQTLEDAQKGKQTSIRFIRHTLPSSSLLKKNQTAQAMGFGGSVFEKALIRSINGKIELSQKEKKQLPLFSNGNDFLQFVEKELDKDVQLLGLNFAYPLSPEGILLGGSKEHDFGELKGKNICNEIEKYIFEKCKQKIKASVANDTICLILSGLTKFKAEEMAAGIVGTGLNFAIFLSDTEVVNLEAAGFNDFEQSLETKEIDKKSNKPGRALFEKETAGAYLYQHFNLKATQAGSATQLSNTKDLNNLAKNDSRKGKIAKELLHHSAELVACMVAGIQMFQKRPLTFIMQGSLFWKADGYKERVFQTAIEIEPRFTPRFEKIEDSGLLGAAKLLA